MKAISLAQEFQADQSRNIEMTLTEFKAWFEEYAAHVQGSGLLAPIVVDTIQSQLERVEDPRVQIIPIHMGHGEPNFDGTLRTDGPVRKSLI